MNEYNSSTTTGIGRMLLGENRVRRSGLHSSPYLPRPPQELLAITPIAFFVIVLKLRKFLPHLHAINLVDVI